MSNVPRTVYATGSLAGRQAGWRDVVVVVSLMSSLSLTSVSANTYKSYLDTPTLTLALSPSLCFPLIYPNSHARTCSQSRSETPSTKSMAGAVANLANPIEGALAGRVQARRRDEVYDQLMVRDRRSKKARSVRSSPVEGKSVPLLARFKGNLGRFSRHRGTILD